MRLNLIKQYLSQKPRKIIISTISVLCDDKGKNIDTQVSIVDFEGISYTLSTQVKKLGFLKPFHRLLLVFL